MFVIPQKEYKDAPFLNTHSPIEFKDSLNNHFGVDGFVNLTDRARVPAPEFTKEEVGAAFDEAAACMSVGWRRSDAETGYRFGDETSPSGRVHTWTKPGNSSGLGPAFGVAS
ncbi:hypothetical protein [Bradyrhizobium erythrophlei]|uniref:hypothetical protein n=1 Tax=Bradyrhizobium erythrophlei TaxID=1437360 RepID=UPI001560C942|nr:hypothetical protein [Bradyrhizobium erythrophlei]